MEKTLPSIPAKRYFTISEVGDLCRVKPHVLRYWEQEFTQLRPMKRRGNRRYYQHHEVLLIRRIRDLLYDQGFTISGARNQLLDVVQSERLQRSNSEDSLGGFELVDAQDSVRDDFPDTTNFEDSASAQADSPQAGTAQRRLELMRQELCEIRDLLCPEHWPDRAAGYNL